MPDNGPQWHTIRSGKLPALPNLPETSELLGLIRSMIALDPHQRPSAADVVAFLTIKSSQETIVDEMAKQIETLKKQLAVEVEERYKLQEFLNA